MKTAEPTVVSAPDTVVTYTYVVTNEGNVLPWLIATKALIHNGCTTGIEAYAMSVPTIAYRATIDEYYDDIYYHLPNSLSHQCFNLDQLQDTVGKILAGKLGAINGDEQRILFKRYFAAQDGPLACERITDVLEKLAENESEWPKPALGDRLEGWYRATRRRVFKQIRSYLPDARIPPELQRHRYPGISLEVLRELVMRFQRVHNYNGEIKADQISDQLFQIST